ncbi:hypothetical protein ACIGBH_07730 [Streptomyces sp. NPDC085929]|uniref:hypothetical protein n=1 Tax=Streptomyces sp. NPDC085929 TaxID=3365739 RepID=UPI0037CD007B
MTKEGIVHDMMAPSSPHALTALYPLLGVPVYAIFDPRTGTGAFLSDIHQTAAGPRYAMRKDFVYGEDVTIGDWTISTEGLPLYA